jgi:acetoin utilization deacetylase AcuC-like enzyme
MIKMSTALIYDPLFLEHNTGLNHPENPQRLNVIIKSLQDDQALWQTLIHIKPRAAQTNDILRCHTEHLIEGIITYCESGELNHLDPDTVVCPKSYEIALLAAGAGIVAVDQLYNQNITNAFCLVRPPGHHATINQAMGFCLFNNIAIAARYAQTIYAVEKILIIDWDVHHGNGRQDIFYDDPSVFYFSTHQYPFYPGTGAANEIGTGKGINTTFNVPLISGTSAQHHRKVFSQSLATILNRFTPDLILISAGFDARKFDPLANLNLSDQDYVEMTQEVIVIAHKYCNDKIISFLEGGYNLGTLGNTVAGHIGALANINI